MREYAILETNDARAIARNPQAAIAARTKRSNPSMLQLRRGRVIHQRKTDSIEAREPFVRADPKIAVGALGNRINRILWQAIIGLPDADAVRDRGVSGSQPAIGKLHEANHGNQQPPAG